jgi:predicted transposase YdaD
MTTELEGCVNDMCNISDLLVEESEERGERRGMERGMARGEKQACLDSIRTLMRKLNQTAEEAMDTLDIEEKDRETYRKLL